MSRASFHEFRRRDVDELRARVGARCSSCDAPTSGPSAADARQSTSVGEAAHICAALPGGPRYDAAMSDEQRREIDNAIWLCRICHKKVDADPVAYPSAMLRQMRAEAQARAAQTLGVPPPSDQTIPILRAMLGAPAPGLTHRAIGHVIQAVNDNLRALDPRFSIETSYQRGVEHTITAREPIAFALTIDSSDTATARAIADMFRHGSTLSIPSHQARFKGSPLLENMTDERENGKGVLTIQPRRVEAAVRLYLKDGMGQTTPLDTMAGTVAVGQDTMTFEGAACSGALRLRFRMPWRIGPSECTFRLDTSGWHGRGLGQIGYLDHLHAIFRRLAAGDMLGVELEREGMHLVSGTMADDPELRHYAKSVCALLSYTRLAQRLDHHLRLGLSFDAAAAFSAPHHHALADAVDIFEGDLDARCCNISSAFSVEMEPVPGFENMLNASSQEGQIVVRESAAQVIEVFGRQIKLPLRELVIEGAQLQWRRLEDYPTTRIMLDITPLGDHRSYYRYIGPDLELRKVRS